MTSENRAFKLAIFDALCACLDLDKNSPAACGLISEAFTEPENSPRPPRKKNCVYWYVMQDNAPDKVATNYFSGSSANDNTSRPTVETTLKYQLIIICYGPDCELNAHKIRHMIFVDGAGFARKILRDAGIYPVPNVSQPTLLHEEEGSLWRRRADLTIPLRVSDSLVGQKRNDITTAPAVIIRR